jgi:hypothetical protein
VGGIGIEVVSGSHSPGDVEAMAAHARATGLYASVGSDFHSPEQTWADLGSLAPLPTGCQPIWQTWASVTGPAGDTHSGIGSAQRGATSASAVTV